jgi:hypothetical protein
MLEQITMIEKIKKEDLMDKIALGLGFTADNYYTACEKMQGMGLQETHVFRRVWG